MLFIVFGATLDMGYETRQIFARKGFDVIKKYNYVAENAGVDATFYKNPSIDENYAKWYDDKIYVENDLSGFDFKYNLDGVYLGFNQKQIMDAVRGITDAILTIGASAVELITQLKNAYGDYVTVINLYEDMATVKASTLYISNSTEQQTRVLANQKMQKLFLQNRKVFDELVIYTGEDSVYNLEALETQYTQIIEERKLLEKRLNNSRYVQLPYGGTKPYVFVSYSHKDVQILNPILHILQKKSYRIWYDDGIHGGKNWRTVLEEKIESCSIVMLLHSANSAASEEVENEISYALDCHIPICVINIDRSPFRKGYNMSLKKVQNVLYDSNNYIDTLFEALPEETKQT